MAMGLIYNANAPCSIFEYGVFVKGCSYIHIPYEMASIEIL